MAHGGTHVPSRSTFHPLFILMFFAEMVTERRTENDMKSTEMLEAEHQIIQKASADTVKAANGGQGKTGQRK